MQGFRDAYTRTRLSRMVGDHQRTARFQRLEQPAIHPCAVDAHERRVVIGEKEGDQIEIAHARWNRIVIVSQHAHDVPHRRGFRTLVEALRRSRRNRLRVLRIDRSAGTDRAGEQLGRIASACSHIEHLHARPHASEREQQLRISSLIGLTVGLGSVRARHDGAVVDVFALTHAGASREGRGAGKNDRPDKQLSVHVYCGGLTPSLLTATRPVVILPSAATCAPVKMVAPGTSSDLSPGTKSTIGVPSGTRILCDPPLYSRVSSFPLAVFTTLARLALVMVSPGAVSQGVWPGAAWGGSS